MPTTETSTLNPSTPEDFAEIEARAKANAPRLRMEDRLHDLVARTKASADLIQHFAGTDRLNGNPCQIADSTLMEMGQAIYWDCHEIEDILNNKANDGETRRPETPASTPPAELAYNVQKQLRDAQHLVFVLAHLSEEEAIDTYKEVATLARLAQDSLNGLQRNFNRLIAAEGSE